jgi:hypothetical protein
MFRCTRILKSPKKIGFGLALAFTLSISSLAAIAQVGDVTDAEMKLLPRYCPDTMGFKYGDQFSNTSPRAAYWVSLMGPSFWAMHHYCWGQITMNRSHKAGVTASRRRAMWESARGDFGYVINNSPPNFIMLPEIYTRVGEVELLLAHVNQANEAFARARELKPDYWPAYSHWAEFLMSSGRRPEALKVVTAGLEHSPDAKVLLELYRVLGGKPSDIPKPAKKPQTQPPAETESEPATPDTRPSPDAKPDEK